MKNRILSLTKHIKNLGIISTLVYLLQRLLCKKENLIRVKVPGLKYHILLRNKTYDTHIFHQIFIREEVDFNIKVTNGIIIDCGANIGLATLYFKKRFPMSKIYALEPESSNFELLKRNTERHNDVVPIHAAVWDKDGKVGVIDTGGGKASFITQNSDDHKGELIEEIRAMTMDSIINEIHSDKRIDLLKIDIEGSEFEIFKELNIFWIERIENLAIEIHENLRPGVTDIIQKRLSDSFFSERIGEYTLFKRRN